MILRWNSLEEGVLHFLRLFPLDLSSPATLLSIGEGANVLLCRGFFRGRDRYATLSRHPSGTTQMVAGSNPSVNMLFSFPFPFLF